VFGFDLAHVVFDAAFVAGIEPYLVVNIIQWMIQLKPFFSQLFEHYTHVLIIGFLCHIDPVQGRLYRQLTHF
jgi:hypothetical protein